MKDLRTGLSEELSALDPPPLGDLVGTAVRQGRRVRRIRTLATVGGSAMAVAAIATLLAVTLGGPAGGQRPTRLGAAAAPAAPTTRVPAASSTPASTPSAPAPTVTAAEASVRTTGPALLAALLKALPRTETFDHFAATSGESPAAQTFLTDGRGTGMLRVFLGTATDQVPCRLPDECFTDSRGQQVRVSHLADNCVESTYVSVEHPDGTAVTLLVSTCLSWNGRQNQPGIAALTVEQAVAIAGDPSISNQMAAGFVQQANDRYRGLSEVS
ncbi:hypothetical protein [Kitasatospora sp. MAP5-34]|uniref:hypothetical protein n=1 Tax=Kitasatospora sp. MAP5-34 TaxID=3035102 RepID=UPI002476889D|nr:hypothetical protein [Kitasatospora sp. MAP5-34]MDH6577397.1 hypothetical protein [Kitasatospora sp. MAP5-34]